MTLATAIKKDKTQKKAGPLWNGPEHDGITFSLLSRFLVCRERFRLLVIEGWKPADTFNHRLEFGNMWHVCEEAFAKLDPNCAQWDDCLAAYAKMLCKRYPLQQEEIDKRYNICKLMFPIYVEYWRRNQDVKDRTPLLQEQVFDVPYKLPSGRTVRLRGKWDAVDLIGKGKDAGVYLQENKTKSDIDESQIKRQLSFDLQTMLYLVAMHEGGEWSWNGKPAAQIKGVRYNVIKRPRQYQGKKETKESFFERLEAIIKVSPGEFFMRWKVEISSGDVVRFRRECLDPVMEQLCDWWEWVKEGRNVFAIAEEDHNPRGIHWRHPFGVWNPMDNGADSELDFYLDSGSTVGLQRAESLFTELS